MNNYFVYSLPMIQTDSLLIVFSSNHPKNYNYYQFIIWRILLTSISNFRLNARKVAIFLLSCKTHFVLFQ